MDVMEKPKSVDGDDVVERAGQLGLLARGTLYLVSALLTWQIATGGRSDEGPGKQGALAAVAEQPFGKVLLIALAVGCAGYAVWRFVGAFMLEADEDDSEAKVWGKRIGYVFRGLVYVGVFFTAVSLLFGDSNSGGSGTSGGGGGETARVFDLPMGRWIVLGAGVGFLVAAAYNAWRAISRKYQEKWDDDMSESERRWASVVSSAGLTGHMAVFALVGFFLTKAAIEFDPSEPEGLDEAVKALADEPGGTAALIVLALAMTAYAGFSFVEARWRELVDEA